MTRNARITESRETEVRNDYWKPPELLPEIPKHPHYGFRWVRAAIHGESDVMNMDMQFRAGWRPATPDDVPNMAHLVGQDSRGEAIIAFGGLVLCKMPLEMIEQRDKHYQGVANNQLRSVNETLREQAKEDKRMPMFNESRTTTSY